jgi:hypothetical protein
LWAMSSGCEDSGRGRRSRGFHKSTTQAQVRGGRRRRPAGTAGLASTGKAAVSVVSTGFPRSGEWALSCKNKRVSGFSTGSTRSYPQVMPRSSGDMASIGTGRCLSSRGLDGCLSTPRRDSFVPTLSTLIHRRPQVGSPAGGKLLTASSTDVDSSWGNRCGQTRRVTKDLTGCGGLWITC